jgi:hypothetical protein
LTVLLFCRLERKRLEVVRLHDVGRDPEAGRRVLAGIRHQRILEARDHHEVRIVGAKRRVCNQLGNHVQGEEADGFAVRRRFAKLVAADDAAGAADILDDDGRLAGDVVRQVLRDDASLDVGRSAGRIVDDHGDGLALVELGKRELRDGGGDERGEGGRQQNSSRHSSTSRTRPSLAARPAARSAWLQSGETNAIGKLAGCHLHAGVAVITAKAAPPGAGDGRSGKRRCRPLSPMGPASAQMKLLRCDNEDDHFSIPRQETEFGRRSLRLSVMRVID